MSQQPQPQQLYKCQTCSQKFSKAEYYEHMICKESVSQLVERVYADARQENVMLRQRITEIGEQTTETIKQKDSQVQNWKSKYEKAQSDIVIAKKEVEIRHSEAENALSRVSDRILEITKLQKEIERLKAEHQDAIIRAQNKHKFECDSINTNWSCKFEKNKLDLETKCMEFEQKLELGTKQFEERLKREKIDIETQITQKFNRQRELDEHLISTERDTYKQILKDKEDRIRELINSSNQLQLQLNACRKKLEESADELHKNCVAQLELKKSCANKVEESKDACRKEISELYAKVKSTNTQNEILIRKIETLEKNHQQEKEQWNADRKILTTQVRNCNMKHLGQETLYNILNGKLDALIKIIKPTNIEEIYPESEEHPVEIESPDEKPKVEVEDPGYFEQE